jgi:hypothetical protein
MCATSNRGEQNNARENQKLMQRNKVKNTTLKMQDCAPQRMLKCNVGYRKENAQKVMSDVAKTERLSRAKVSSMSLT